MARSLKSIALIVSLGTLLSKAGGLTRQLLIAGAFGVGAAYDAYNYAYILPGFLLVLLGGLNGPFHSAMVSVLSKRPKKESAYVLAALSTMIGSLLIVVTGVLIIAANQIIKIVGPGLDPEIHRIAVIQLQIMAPMALLAGLIGLGFGYLNATNQFWIPSISPLMSSITLILGVGLFWMQTGAEIGAMKLAIRGGMVLAISTLTGALFQWLIQLPALLQKGVRGIKLIWDWRHPAVKEVWKIIGPATFSSGMMQINVCTDLFFASAIPGAAAGLSYASLLVQAPLGLFSNALLVPLLPTFSQLTKSEDREKLIARVRQGVMLSTASMVATGALFVALGTPIVAIIYERGAFDSNAVSLVASLLIAYGLCMPAYLCRDLLVRVFYALGDGITPFKLSTICIVLNVLFDWLLIGGPSPWGDQLPFNFGAPGLVIATGAVNLFSCVTLIIILKQKLGKIPLKEWSKDLAKLFFIGSLAGISAWIVKNQLHWPTNLLGLLLQVTISSLTGLIIFFFISNFLGVKEVNQAFSSLRKQIIHHQF